MIQDRLGALMLKLPSGLLLFHTLLVLPVAGNAPLSVALPLPHDAEVGQTGGKAWPTVTVVAVPV